MASTPRCGGRTMAEGRVPHSEATPPLVYLFGARVVEYRSVMRRQDCVFPLTAGSTARYAGLPGAGKNFVGEELARIQGAGWRFLDADEWLLPDMRASLAAKQGFSPDQRERYYTHVCERVRSELPRSAGPAPEPEVQPVEATKTGSGTGMGKGGGLVVAQATFKAQHRRLVAAALPSALLCWVRCSEATRITRLQQRHAHAAAGEGGGGEALDPELGERMLREFEAPRRATRTSASAVAGEVGSGVGGGDEGSCGWMAEDACHAVIDNDGDLEVLRQQLRALL
eukprot:SAG25_NODE_56_length_18517_cov_197.286296_7_plen_284_part_00